MLNLNVCVVAGAGPGNGTAFSRRFASAGYRVAMLARSAERLTKLEAAIPGTKGYAVDLSDGQQVHDVCERIRADLGPVGVLIHNAVTGSFGPFMNVQPEQLEAAFRTNTVSLLRLAQELVPGMLAAGGGAIVAVGNTAALRGRANFAGFAPTKAAQRSLAQSMARSLGPQGIHVAYVVIDAVIDVPWTRVAFAGKPDQFFIEPAAIAETVYHLTQQDRSGWTFEIDLRPFGEEW